MTTTRRILGAFAVAALCLATAGLAGGAVRGGGPNGNAGAAAAAPNCQLANGIKRVVVLDFDNVHLTRDIPNVPSDLEQMPHLLNFLKENGTVLNKHYTILIS